MRCLLIHLAVVFQPAALPSSGRIMVRPMHNATALVPLVYSGEIDDVPNPNRLNAWRNINIVRNQYRISRRQTENKPLMTVTGSIVFKSFCNDSTAVDQRTVCEFRSRRGAAKLKGGIRILDCRLLESSRDQQDEQNNARDYQKKDFVQEDALPARLEQWRRYND